MIAFREERNKLTILNIITKQIIKELILDNQVINCKFSNDCNFLYLGDSKE